MTKVRCLAELLIFLCLPFASTPLRASAPPPTVLASTSSNGHFLVVAERQFDSPDETIPRKILRTTYRVLETEQFINSKDHLVSAVPFYSASAFSWKVTLEGYGSSQFWPMVSDDGHSLVLVAVTPAVPKLPVMQTYRQEQFDAKLVRALHITDLWTPAQIDPAGKSLFNITDATPQWFSGGSLNISPNNQDLIYRTQWGDVLLIDLATGAIRRDP